MASPRFLRSFEIILFIIQLMLIAWFVVYPLLQMYFWRIIDFSREVDPEYLNGLLTVSSILFGFISMAVIEGNIEDKKIWFMLFIALFLIIHAGSVLYNVVVGIDVSMEATIWLLVALQVNAAVAMYVLGYLFGKRHFGLEEENRCKDKEESIHSEVCS